MKFRVTKDSRDSGCSYILNVTDNGSDKSYSFILQNGLPIRDGMIFIREGEPISREQFDESLESFAEDCPREVIEAFRQRIEAYARGD